MKKVFLALAMVFLMVGGAWAGLVPLSGTITPGNGMYATEDWNNSSTSLTWDVFQPNPGFWEYEYTFTVPSKDISHLIIQVSDNFTTSDIFTGTTSGGSLDLYGPGRQGNSDPGIPADIYGIKWDATGTSLSVTIVTDRMPMDGNFYAKDGKSGDWVYAYSGNANGFFSNIPVPDTKAVPLPASLLLAGTGLIPFIRLRKKR